MQKNSVGVNKNVKGRLFRKAFTHICNAWHLLTNTWLFSAKTTRSLLLCGNWDSHFAAEQQRAVFSQGFVLIRLKKI